MKYNDYTLLYYTYNDISKARTNSISDVHLCEGFSENGIDTHLICFAAVDMNISVERINEVYNINHKINYHIIRIKENVYDNRFLRIILIIYIFLKTVLRNIFRFKSKKIIMGTRNSTIGLFFVILNKLLNNRLIHFLWIHEKDSSKISKYVYKKINKLCFTNHNILKEIAKDTNLKYHKNSITYNPVQFSLLNMKINKSDARKKIKYISNQPLIVYTGKLYFNQKETDYIISAAKKCPEYNFILTGGKPNVVAQLNNLLESEGTKNVYLTGFLDDYREVHYYQMSADVLISYYCKSDHLVDYNFPQKILEYMLTGNPLVTPNYPATSCLLNHTNCIIVKPDNLESLIEGINTVVKEKYENMEIGKNAKIIASSINFKSVCNRLLGYIIDPYNNN